MRSVRLAAAGVLLGALVLAACAPKRVQAPLTEPPQVPVEAPGKPVTLRVGLAESQKHVVIVPRGPCALRIGVEARDLRTVAAGEVIDIERRDDQVHWVCGDDDGKTPLVLVAPLTDEACLRWNGTAWRGNLLVLATPQDAGLTLVNELPLEVYLRGVVPAEIGRAGPSQVAAVEAQAVAARTYAVAHLGTRVSRGFDLYADVRDQVYRGVAGEDSLATAAIARTAGLVLMHDGAPIHAYYHATCGGCSDVPDAVWPRPAEPYFAVRDDGPGPGGEAYCASAAHARWTETWTTDQLTRILASTLPDYLDHMAAPERAAWAGATFTPAHPGVDERHPGSLQRPAHHVAYAKRADRLPGRGHGRRDLPHPWGPRALGAEPGLGVAARSCAAPGSNWTSSATASGPSASRPADVATVTASACARTARWPGPRLARTSAPSSRSIIPERVCSRSLSRTCRDPGRRLERPPRRRPRRPRAGLARGALVAAVPTRRRHPLRAQLHGAKSNSPRSAPTYASCCRPAARSWPTTRAGR